MRLDHGGRRRRQASNHGAPFGLATAGRDASLQKHVAKEGRCLEVDEMLQPSVGELLVQVSALGAEQKGMIL